jgi:hypothetical protein
MGDKTTVMQIIVVVLVALGCLLLIAAVFFSTSEYEVRRSIGAAGLGSMLLVSGVFMNRRMITRINRRGYR